MSREEKESSSKHAAGTRRRRRHRSAFRLILGDPYEQTAEYPGFFVLRRAKHQAGSAAVSQPSSHPRWEQFKETVIVLLVLGGFAAVLGYFFYHVTPSWTAPETQAPPQFVSDPRLLPTNHTDGLPR
jgi:hypothetical protein